MKSEIMMLLFFNVLGLLYKCFIVWFSLVDFFVFLVLFYDVVKLIVFSRLLILISIFYIILLIEVFFFSVFFEKLVIVDDFIIFFYFVCMILCGC